MSGTSKCHCGELATRLVKAIDSDAKAPVMSTFYSDLPPTHWASCEVHRRDVVYTMQLQWQRCKGHADRPRAVRIVMGHKRKPGL